MFPTFMSETSNNNLSKAVYCSDLLETSEYARFVQWNGDTLNTPFKAGLTDCQEGFAFCYGNWNDYMTVIAFAKNSNKMWGRSKASGNWVEYATKSDLFSRNWITNPNTCTTPFSVVNGWSHDLVNIPDDAKSTWNSLQTTWLYPTDIGDLTKVRLQILITGNNTVHTRMYENGNFENWS